MRCVSIGIAFTIDTGISLKYWPFKNTSTDAGLRIMHIYKTHYKICERNHETEPIYIRSVFFFSHFHCKFVY